MRGAQGGVFTPSSMTGSTVPTGMLLDDHDLRDDWNTSMSWRRWVTSQEWWPGRVIGAYGYLVSLGTCAWAFFTGHYAIVPACIFAFIAAHAVGQGAVIWVLISEIFPTRYRAEGQALGSFTHWIFAALLTTFFPMMVTAFAPGLVFLFFTVMMAIQMLWVALGVRETKGVPVEEMQQRDGLVA